MAIRLFIDFIKILIALYIRKRDNFKNNRKY
jgi:hypothetical protein